MPSKQSPEGKLWRMIAKGIMDPSTSPYLCDHIRCERYMRPYTRSMAVGSSHLLQIGHDMVQRIQFHINGAFSAYIETDVELEAHREARSLACFWMAQEADEKFQNTP
jgi:hypothetical protein